MLQELKEVEILNTKFQIDYRNMLDNFILILQVLLCWNKRLETLNL